MKLFRVFVFVLAAVLSIGGLAAAQEGKADPGMEQMMKMASPGENHKHLGKLVGDWTFANKMYMDPAQPPAESTGTMQAEWTLGGRFVKSVWKGEFMGMPFEGHGTDGYDNLAKIYVSTWMDSMGTGIMYATGTCDAEGKTCTSSGDMMDPMSGQKVTSKSTLTWKDDKTFVMEMFVKDPSGKEMKTMELTATKK
jgi:hypothetical protein